MAVNVKSRPSTARFGAASALAAFLFSGCASALIGTAGPNRVIHARITVDKAFASDFSWRDNVAALIRHANGRLESWMSVEIAIDTVFVFTPSEAGGAAGLPEPEILMERVPPGASDIVIHFSREYGIPRDNTLGLTFRENGYIIVSQMEALQGPDPFHLLYFTLLHEMGHLLGAMHVLGDRHSTDIMEPAFKRNFFHKEGKAIGIVEPVFHPGNVIIMNALRNRSFRRNGWRPADFENIRAAYAGAVLRYNNLEKDRAAGLGLSNLAFSPLEPPLALSMWASLCGRDTLALAYTDSLQKTADELRQFCLYAPKGGGSREVCGRLTLFGNEWYEALPVLLHYNRAVILVRARRFREAAEEFDLFKGKLDARWDTDIPYLTRYYERERMLYGAPALTDTTAAVPDTIPAAADTTVPAADTAAGRDRAIAPVAMPMKTDSVRSPAHEIRAGLDMGFVLSGGQMDFAKAALRPMPDGLSRIGLGVRSCWWGERAGFDLEYVYSVTRAVKDGYEPLSLYDQHLIRAGGLISPPKAATPRGLHRAALRGGLNYELLWFSDGSRVPSHDMASGPGCYLMVEYDFIHTSRFLWGMTLGYEFRNPKMEDASEALSSHELVFSLSLGYHVRE